MVIFFLQLQCGEKMEKVWWDGRNTMTWTRWIRLGEMWWKGEGMVVWRRCSGLEEMCWNGEDVGR